MISSRFKSLEATPDFAEQKIVKINGRMPQIFVLAVQEANFFYSFTVSFFIAMTVLCDQVMDAHFDTVSALLLFWVSLCQLILGAFTCLYLYGRKVSPDEFDDDDDEDNDDSDPYGMAGQKVPLSDGHDSNWVQRRYSQFYANDGF
jgi:hypothetical protein